MNIDNLPNDLMKAKVIPHNNPETNKMDYVKVQLVTSFTKNQLINALVDSNELTDRMLSRAKILVKDYHIHYPSLRCDNEIKIHGNSISIRFTIH